MDKCGMSIFTVGQEINDIKQASADYWIIYIKADKLEFFIQDKAYCGVAGQVLIVSAAGQKVHFCAGSEFEGYLLQINDQVCTELVHRHMLFMDMTDSAVAVLDTGRQEQGIQVVFRNMVAEMRAGGEKTILHILLQELLARLYRTNSQMHAGTYTNKKAIALGIRDFLEKKYYCPLSIEIIATEFNMSESYLSHIFKEVTGMSIMRCLLLIRINAAQQFLVQTNFRISEIAEKCGFNDVSNFGRNFRKETGCSPREYRNKHC